MERSQFERVKAHVTAATAGQILELEEVIQRVIAQQFTEMALARRTRQTLQTRICPLCQGNNIVLHGKDRNGRQRFKCRGCRRSYNILTGTPMARARKPEKWGEYLVCMTEHMSVRKIVASGIGVHQVTAWRWRHRFLQAAANDNTAILSGVVEANETFFPRSFKGSRGWKTGKPPANRAARPRAWGPAKPGLSHEQVPVLTALDNSCGVFEAILESLTDIEAALEGRIAAGSVLCSDGRAAYVRVADNAYAEHYTVFFPDPTQNAVNMNPVASSARKPGRLGLGRVNSHHQKLKHLINEQCRGVATIYLGNYLGWHRAMIGSGFEGKALLAWALA
jgi:transposase-like protein